MPSKTENGKWYDVNCDLEGQEIKIVTTQNTYLSITGVQVYIAGGRRTTTSTSTTSIRLTNIRLSGASQSSPYGNNRFPAINAINGSGKFTHTNKGVGMWWKASFGGSQYTVYSVRIRNRKDCCGQRLAMTKVMIGSQLCGQTPAKTTNGAWYTVQCSKGLKGGEIKLVTTRNEYLSITGILVFVSDARR